MRTIYNMCERGVAESNENIEEQSDGDCTAGAPTVSRKQEVRECAKWRKHDRLSQAELTG